MMSTHHRAAGTALGILLALAGTPTPAHAHCDTMNGPVVKAAVRALELGDVTSVLRWVKPADEAVVRAAFTETLAVRKLGPKAQALADRYFFETLVRIHRAGEGEPYTGLKPADTPTDPAVAAADEALDRRSVDALTAMIAEHAAKGIRERFEQATTLKAKADSSVEAGREFVEAYVQFTHYVEAVHLAVAGAEPEHGATAHAERPATDDPRVNWQRTSAHPAIRARIGG